MKHRKENAIRFGPLGPNCVHLCVDMQKLFTAETDWNTPWLHKVLPKVRRIAEAHPAETIFTRFITLARPEAGVGTWKRYYERWRSMTAERLSPDMTDLLDPLQALVPPAEILDKRVYSPWLDDELSTRLKARGTETIVVTGGETDVCVLGTVLGAVDRGYRTVIVTDALCSSSDDTHDAMMTLYHSRYDQQVETVETDLLLEEWPPPSLRHPLADKTARRAGDAWGGALRPPPGADAEHTAVRPFQAGRVLLAIALDRHGRALFQAWRAGLIGMRRPDQRGQERQDDETFHTGDPTSTGQRS